MTPRVLVLLLVPFPALAQSAPPPPPVPAPAPEPAPADSGLPRPLRLSFAATSAFGFRNAGFFNQLVGVRLDYRFSPRFAFGGALSYANLKGKEDRVHNLLPEAMLEYRVPLSGEGLGVPLRFATGFLPQNGPTLRVSAGLDFSLSDRLALEVIALEPMVWVNRDRPEVSMNGTLSLKVAF